MTPQQKPRRLIGVSTKMYFSHARTREYISKVIHLLSTLSPETRLAIASTTDVFVIPDHVSLVSVIEQLRASSSSFQREEQEQEKKIKILVGAQTAHHADSGAYTGEVSPAVLSEIGCSLLELNHAERRRFFAETDESTALKVAGAVRNGLVPLICVGERSRPPVSTGKDENGKEEEVLDVKAAMQEISSQIATALSSLTSEQKQAQQVILAYEPVWAIGAPEPASPSYVVAVAREIRKLDCLRDWTQNNSVRILYGGSAGPGLYQHLRDEVDGLFLGRFAHDPEMFVKTIVEVATV
ncbi:mitochondrial triosephosphate isomerase [Xylariaceae sp. FL0594]|nr:mitochondrial triosephosphate isomerase [Xylariaceae sp. FL0594]